MTSRLPPHATDEAEREAERSLAAAHDETLREPELLPQQRAGIAALRRECLRIADEVKVTEDDELTEALVEIGSRGIPKASHLDSILLACDIWEEWGNDPLDVDMEGPLNDSQAEAVRVLREDCRRLKRWISERSL